MEDRFVYTANDMLRTRDVLMADGEGPLVVITTEWGAVLNRCSSRGRQLCPFG